MEDNNLESAMRAANGLTNLSSTIVEIVLELANKRVTLEEKMIKVYLHELAVVASHLVAVLHSITRDGAKSESDVIAEVAQITQEAQASVDELLKIIRYDLNFLEQYFEKDFYDKMALEHKYVERLQNLQGKLATATSA